MEQDTLVNDLSSKLIVKKNKFGASNYNLNYNNEKNKNFTNKNNYKTISGQNTYEIVISDITDEEYKRRTKIFEKLRDIVLPEQRSKEWFDMRNNKITASDCGAVLGENKYEPTYNFIHKKVFGSTFETNNSCYHGKKFENVVTLMYEYNYDTVVDEFGLLGHPEHLFLGASPDGICGPYKRDGKTKSSLVGRMLEIKCPLFRKIKYEGEVKGEICPIYYWCQVQQQLECCDLDECDFVQCSIEEYNSRDEFIKDSNITKNFISKKSGFEKGALIELIPLKISEEDIKDNKIADNIIFDKTTFIYQPKIDMTTIELDNWLLNELDKVSIRTDVKLNRIIYWRILEKDCTLILRDKDWFNEVLPKLQKIWNYVEILRKDNELAQKWKDYINSLAKKMNDKIIMYLDKLINNKN
jgi:putative phage-type endonuclease